MNVAVIGTGYIGIVGAAVFADWGNTVVGVDIDTEKISKIKRGEMPIYEPGLSELILKNVSEKRLDFTTSLADGIKNAEVVFICVGTPQSDSGAADLSYVFKVAEQIGKNLNGYKVIVTKSTVPVGTNEKIKEIIAKNAPLGAKFDVASNPEFLREGSSVEDMRNTDRTVIGTDSIQARDVMRAFYSVLDVPLMECDLRSAEMIKYAANSFLATKITFINEISQLCERTGADVSMVAKGMGLDKRIGSTFLKASIGYGGSCFPKDVAALHKTGMDNAFSFRILRAVIEANDLQKDYYIKKIVSKFGENLSGLTFGCLGLAFKDNTDDIRESVAIKIVRMIRGMGADIKVYDPQAMENAKKVLGNHQVTFFNDMYEALLGVDAVCLLTEWTIFKDLDLAKVADLVKNKIIFDGRNLLDPVKVREAGFEYTSIGRK